MGVVISKEAKTENVLHVPDDVITEILAKLPVKSLLRFNCVCKTWYSVISDPRFCNNLHRMRPCILICENSKKFSTITIESLLTSKNRAPTHLSLPWEAEADDYCSNSSNQNQFLGSCNGLVCVDLKSESSPDRSGLILWNPSTRKLRRLPSPSCYQVQDNFFTYAWFGYDESVDDYKLVWLNCSSPFHPPRKETRLEVFTLKSNTWRRPPIDHIKLPSMNFFKANDQRNPKSIGVLSNGAIHWGINYPGPSGGYFCSVILALDLATEKFRVLGFPHFPLRSDSWVGSLLGGCLCLCSISRFHNEAEEEEEDGCGGMTLWMMKEYGVESSWTKLISIPYTFIRSGFGFFRFYPILFSKEESKEIVAMFDYVREQIGDNYGVDEIVKLRIEEGGENVRFEETLLCVPRVRNGSPHEVVEKCQNNVVLHMESLVSLTAAD